MSDYHSAPGSRLDRPSGRHGSYSQLPLGSSMGVPPGGARDMRQESLSHRSASSLDHADLSSSLDPALLSGQASRDGVKADPTHIYRKSSRGGLLQGKWSQNLDADYEDTVSEETNPSRGYESARDRVPHDRSTDEWDSASRPTSDRPTPEHQRRLAGEPDRERQRTYSSNDIPDARRPALASGRPRAWRASLEEDEDEPIGLTSSGRRRMSGTPDGLAASLRQAAITSAANRSGRIEVELGRPSSVGPDGGSPPMSALGRRGSFSSDVSSHLSDNDDDPQMTLQRVLVRIIRKSKSIPLPTLKLKLYERKPHLRSTVRSLHSDLRAYLTQHPEVFEINTSERVPTVKLAQGVHGKSLFSPAGAHDEDSAGDNEYDAVDTSDGEDDEGPRTPYGKGKARFNPASAPAVPSNAPTRSPASSVASNAGSSPRGHRPPADRSASPSSKPQPAAGAADRGIDHLVFVVHGIGGGLLNGARVEHHRQTIANNVRSVMKESYPSVDMNLHFELVEWRSCLGEYTEDVDVQIKSLTLKGVKKMRDFANDIFLDAMYFMHNVYYHAIITEVTHQMNSAYEEFVRTHDNFSGKVSVFAHSLGSVIMWDIIEPIDPSVFLGSHMKRSETQSPRARPGRRLNFDIETFFCTGSPLGVFLSLRRKHLGKDWVAPVGCKYFFNVFHPFDPVAYRIEALISSSLSKLDPEKCPTQGGVERSHVSKKTFWQKIGLSGGGSTTAKSSTGGAPVDATAALFQIERRFDFELQESFVEGVNEYLTAIRAHHCYWAHRDVGLFVVKQLLATSDDYFYLFDGHHM